MRLIDARKMLCPRLDKRNRSEFVCDDCGERGALIACVRCLKVSHLGCIRAGVMELPLAEWACAQCGEEYYGDMVVALEKYVDEQNAGKRGLLGKLAKRWRRMRKAIEMKEFESEFPQFVEMGQVVYPISDEVLWMNPRMHKVEVRERPKEWVLSEEQADAAVFLCDFCYTFKEYLGTPGFDYEELFGGLGENYETEIVKGIMIGLIKPLVKTMFTAERFKKKGAMLSYLLYKIRKIVSVEELLECSYLRFIDYIFQTDAWTDLIKEIDIDLFEFYKEFSFADSFYSLPAGYKLQLLVLFADMLLETIDLNEVCTIRVNEYLALCKQLKSESKQPHSQELSQEDLLLQQKQRTAETSSFSTRTNSLGSDHCNREYFIFAWDTSKLYMRAATSPLSDTCKWSFYGSASEISALIQSLTPKGIYEQQLISTLTEALSSNKFTFSTEKQQKNSRTKEYDLKTLKEWTRKLHLTIAETLEIEASTGYLNAIETSDFKQMLILITNFHKAFLNTGLEETNSISKQVLRLWDHSNLSALWEYAVNDCKNPSEVFICMHLLARMVERFNKERKMIEVTESAYSKARRTYKMERLSRMRKEIEKDDGYSCYVCGEYGFVVCCEKCTNVAHLDCVQLERLPKDEWICPQCVDKDAVSKASRSKQIKY
jgi:6-pyruvoyl-tetrahydropterin synthase